MALYLHGLKQLQRSREAKERGTEAESPRIQFKTFDLQTWVDRTLADIAQDEFDVQQRELVET